MRPCRGKTFCCVIFANLPRARNQESASRLPASSVPFLALSRRLSAASWADTVTQPSLLPATGPTDHCPGGTCTHEVNAPFGAHNGNTDGIPSILSLERPSLFRMRRERAVCCVQS